MKGTEVRLWGESGKVLQGPGEGGGKAGSKDMKWVEVRINNEETEVSSTNRMHGISEDV